MNALPKRPRKRDVTRQKIAEESLRLYETYGYEATTLAAISKAAGISARTFFLHFPTKEDTLKYWRNEGFLRRLEPVMAQLDGAPSPLEEAFEGIKRLIDEQEPTHSARVDRLLESNEALWAHKQQIFVQFEHLLRDCLSRSWTEESAEQLAMVAMMATGVMRLAMSRWRADGAVRTIQFYLDVEIARMRRAFYVHDRDGGGTAE